jgi:hypothetical protein
LSVSPFADLRNVVYVIWRHLNLPSPTPLQYDIAQYIQNAPERAMVQAFRGAGKSWITAAAAIWYIHNKPEANIVVISAAKQRADFFTSFVLRLLNEIPEFAHLRPRPGQRQRADAFDVGPASAKQTPSVVSIGIGGAMTGNRADFLVADDIEISNNSETQTQREKLAERIKEFESILKPGGKILFLGTPQSEDSVYNDIEARGYDLKLWPALYPEQRMQTVYGSRLSYTLTDQLRADPTLAGRSTDPDRFPDHDLDKRRLALGRISFSLQFLLDPSLSDVGQYPLRLSDLIVYPLDARFAPRRIAWTSLDSAAVNTEQSVGFRGDLFHRGFLPDGEKTAFDEYQGTLMYVDPAGGRGRDETAWAIVSVLNGMLYLRDAGAIRDMTEASLTKIAEAAKAMGVNRVVVEPNYGGSMFRSLLTPIMGKVHPCSVQDSEWSKGVKEKRILGILEPVISGHRLVISEHLIRKDYESTLDLPPEMRERYRLFYQLTRLTSTPGCLMHDDRIEAVAGAVREWEQAVSVDTAKASREAARRAKDKELDELMRRLGRPVKEPVWAEVGTTW